MDLAIRAGVHTGEVELRGDDISGISVNIAARIADRAASGEILTSDLTRQLMIGSSVVFDARGEYALKGVPGDWPPHLHSSTLANRTSSVELSDAMARDNYRRRQLEPTVRPKI